MAKTTYNKSSAAKKAVYKAGGAGKRAGLIAGVIIASLVLLVLVAVLLWGTILVRSDTVFPHVHVAGVSVGGLRRSAAIGEVRETLEGKYDRTFEVRLPDRTLEFAPDDVNVDIDVEEAVEIAVEYGRSDGAFMAAINYIRFAVQKRVDVPDLSMAMELDREYIEDTVKLTAKDVHADSVNTEVSVEDNEITIVKGCPGVFLDEELLVDAIVTAFERCELEPMQWQYSEVPYLEADMQTIFNSVATLEEDAYYDEENREVVEEVVGLRFDPEKEAAKLAKLDYGQTMTIVMEEAVPEVTAESINEEMFGDKLESRSSPYVNNPNRTENLRIACEAINGTILNPGDVFSFNETVGERTEERGFKPATIYGGDGESVDGVGGGICQVASTIYYTTLYMNLEQVMREPHMYRVTYVPLGMDATVYWDSGLDYKFRNTLSNPIKIQANVDGGYVNITFWGIKENDNYVVMTNSVVDDAPMETVREVDETKEPGYEEQKQSAYIGAKVEAYQKVYAADGTLISEKTIKSVYKGRPEILIVGPEEEEPLDPENPENPDDPFHDPEEEPIDPDLPAEEEEWWEEYPEDEELWP